MKIKYKEQYRALKKPQIINTKEQIIISIKGSGNPNDNIMFQKHIESLYKLSYAFRMSYKKDGIAGYYTYTVGPLEGFWTTIDRKVYDQNKDNLAYEIFITQPDFITKDVFLAYQYKLMAMDNEIDKVEYKIIKEGLVGQILHVGSFDDEQVSVDILNEYLEKNNYEVIPDTHHEIYLSDFRRVEEDRRKTLIRYQIRSVDV